MAEQKFEDLLNISLEATREERERSIDLGVGVSEQNDIWEIIFKYVGDISYLEERFPDTRIIPLLYGYAVATLPRRYLEELTTIPEIEYIEKPKLLFFQDAQSFSVSCITPVKEIPLQLNGEGVIVAVIDSGINIFLPEFQDEGGNTRLLYIWDQTVQGEGPKPYGIGREYNQEQINAALQSGQRIAGDPADHGTPVTSIAGGGTGVADGSGIIFVKLLPSNPMGFPRTTQIMMGIDYVLRKAAELKRPVAVNLSIGNNYGSHTGTSILERYMDDVGRYWKSVICVGSGNEGAAATHAGGRMEQGKEETISLAVSRYQPVINIQIWTRYSDEFEVRLILPDGRSVGPVTRENRLQRFETPGMRILGYRGEPSPYSVYQEIYFDLIPEEYVTAGVWQIQLSPIQIVDGTYNIWLPSDALLNVGTGFLNPTAQNTLTLPSTAQGIITVGAYNGRNDAFAAFSGRGGEAEHKPDLVAPGVDVNAISAGGMVRSYSGTSFATPLVTGCAALLMEWGIERGNDPYLYGEKVKAYLIRGARQLYGEPTPSDRTGWGAVCLQNSFPDRL